MSNSVSNTPYYLGELAAHSLLGTASGATATKLLGADWSQGTAVGLAMGTANGLAQKTIAYFTSIEETPAFRIGVSVAMLAAVLLTANTSLGLSLLGRVGVSLSPNVLMILGLSTFISEYGLALVPRPEKAKSQGSQKVKTSLEELAKEIMQAEDKEKAASELSPDQLKTLFNEFNDILEKARKGDFGFAKVNGRNQDLQFENALQQRFEKAQLYPKSLETKKDVTEAKPHVIRYFFKQCYLPEDAEAKQAFISRIKQLKLPHPILSKEGAKYFNIWDFYDNEDQLRWIWKHEYSEFIQHLPEDKRIELDLWIHDAVLGHDFKYLQDISDVAKLTDSQLRLIALNYYERYQGKIKDTIGQELKKVLREKKIEIRP